MEKKSHFLLSFLFPFFLFIIVFASLLQISTGSGLQDGSESWGYVEVRPKAHMFWWYYRSPYRTENPEKPWPIVLWLQGGPGASGVGIGNFEEVGPLDISLQPRNSTWLKKADLLFVDNPVGTGYSFVEDPNLFVKNDVENANDLTTLLIEIFNRNVTFQNSPLYIVAESYGGKFAVTLGLSALKAIESKKLKLILGGVVLGDSWISPEDYVVSWGPLLKDVSRLDDNGLREANSLALTIKELIAAGKLKEATEAWGDLEFVISMYSHGVDFYNFLLDSNSDPLSTMSKYMLKQKYSNYFSPGGSGALNTLMNGAVKKKLRIPKDVVWGSQANDVFEAMSGDFMNPRINEVDELLSKGVNVTVYNGQVDLICATKGTEAWVSKLKWEGLKSFLSKSNDALYCGDQKTRGFFRSHKNFYFYYILGAGHFVPVDEPCLALKMLETITGSPAKT